MTIRQVKPTDFDGLARLMHELWPDCQVEEALSNLREKHSTMPLTQFVAEEDGTLIGFVEVSLRSHVDGCDCSRPAGFLEGWFVAESHRRRGIGGELVRAAEDWARAQGCHEMGSDTWIDRDVSQQAHQALGYEVVDRCVHFRKDL
jgi:aminoglycoside 6'-N-acetyltransferase I